MTDTLINLPTPQWTVETLQMVNWGSWHGYHRIDLHPGATLLSGASGTGKSTVMDAYTALMMPSEVPFNGASNDAVSGRARGETQRNIPSYIRGKQGDEQETGTDEMRARVLRGSDTSAWSAIAATFASTDGRRFTVLRAYYLPRGVIRMADGGTTKLATIDGTLNLADLGDVVADKFHARSMERRFPGMKVTTKFSEHSQAVTTHLGIGRHGDGLMALRLLARIQAGHALSTVDDTYKTMVLDTPSTYRSADRTLEHFADLEASYESMKEEDDKRRTLDGIEQAHEAVDAAQATTSLLNELGLGKQGVTPGSIWLARTESAMLSAAEQANSTQRAACRNQQTTAASDEARLATKVDEIKAEQAAAGGTMLERLDREIDELTAERDIAVDTRRTFDKHTAALPEITTADQLSDATAAAAQFEQAYDTNRTRLATERADLMQAAYPISRELSDLKAERDSLTGRSGRVPRDLHEARLAFAKAAMMNPEDLPFVAELIDIPDGETQWRAAIETTLFGLARTLIVDSAHLERFSRAIDSVNVGLRVSFQGVPARDYAPREGDPDRISGKLDYKEGPYTHWAASRIASTNIDAICVATPDELAGSDRRVTISGQMRHGHSGAHGRSRAPHIIGFTSETRLEEIEDRLSELLEEDAGIQARSGAIDSQQVQLENLRAAYQQVQSTSWRAIDVDGITADIVDRRARKAEILAASDRLAKLAEDAARTGKQLEDARERKHTATSELKTLDVQHEKLVEQADKVNGYLDEVEQSGVVLTGEQAGVLDKLHAATGQPGNLDALEGDVVKLHKAVTDRIKDAESMARREADLLEKSFKAFNARWPDPNRGATLEDYPEFKTILDKIASTGLVERRHEFTRAFTEWTGDDLVPLSGAFETSIETIEDRLGPVNEILARLEFGPRGQHLRIDLKRKISEEVGSFLRELRRLASQATGPLSDDQVVARFIELRGFLNPLRARPAVYADATGRIPKDAPTSRRDVLLDVRKHVKITAVALDADGVAGMTYDTLSHLSGGENQELTGFLVGSALKYQLGDENQTRSTFAPVWLDEAFIKADSEFTGRAITAWRGLGFQLVVAAPNEKTSGLEPQMDQIVAITKSTKGYSHATPLRRDKPETAA